MPFLVTRPACRTSRGKDQQLKRSSETIETRINRATANMATSLSDLIAKKEALDRLIHEAQASANNDAIAQVRKLMAEFGLTVADLTAAPVKRGTNAGAKVAPKYRDPTSGSTWTGRGLKPKWLSLALEGGKKLEDFAI
jgi:DNA-binding protein H-NS